MAPRRSARRGPVLGFVLALLVAGCEHPEQQAGDPVGRPPATSPSSDPTTEDPSPGPGRPGPSATSVPSAVPAGDDTTVASVTDGDTIVVADGRRVRLIGVDTPESTTARYGHVECFGSEATAYLRDRLPPGTAVRLIADVEALDRYGRTLAYVHRLDDGWFANLALAEDGFAQVLTIPPNVAHSEELREAVARARAAGRGLWSGCGEVSSTTATTATTAMPPRTGPTPAGCDPAYPGVCIPPGPPAGPDLDCGDIADRRFEVRQPDPHRFDGNGDGIGCESGP